VYHHLKMFDEDPIGRRTVLKRTGTAIVGATALAGCSGGDGGGGDGNDNGDSNSDGGDNSSGNNDFGGWLTDAKNYDGSVADETGSDQVTVEVGVGSDGFAFGPVAVRVSTGTEVQWEWTGKGGQHNVHAEEGASFESDLYEEAGVHFSHTFEETGTVKYQCDPHSSVGMKGVVVVE
jgi:halocyanin-like protein